MKYIKENNLFKDSKIFSESDIEKFSDLDLDDWKNAEERDLFSPYSFENYYQLLITPDMRIDTVYVLSKLEQKYWKKIFERCLYLLIGLKVFFASDLMLLSMLTDDEFERADKLGIFDYDNVLMKGVSCKALYKLAKYPKPLLEEAVKRNIYNRENEYKKLLSDPGLFSEMPDNKIAFDMRDCSRENFKTMPAKIKDKVLYLKSTQPFLPQNSLKNSGFCIKNIEEVSDCSRLQKFIHGVSSSVSLDSFLKLKNEDVLSASYVNFKNPENKLFYNQGLILQVKPDDIHAGYYKDMRTFEQLNVETLLAKYIFHSQNNPYRTYFSSILRKALGFDTDASGDDLYIDFIEKYKDKSLEEIQDKEIQTKIFKYLDSIPVKCYEARHNNNEILVTNPLVEGVYVSGRSQVPDYLLSYAKDFDLPVYFSNNII